MPLCAASAAAPLPTPPHAPPSPLQPGAKSKAPARPQRSSGGAPRRAPPKAQAGGGGGGGGGRVPRTTSVNSYKNYQALPAEQQAALAEALQARALAGAGAGALAWRGVDAVLPRAPARSSRRSSLPTCCTAPRRPHPRRTRTCWRSRCLNAALTSVLAARPTTPHPRRTRTCWRRRWRGWWPSCSAPTSCPPTRRARWSWTSGAAATRSSWAEEPAGPWDRRARRGRAGRPPALPVVHPVSARLPPVPPRSVLTPGVVWELYEFVIGRPPAPPQPARSSFQLQARAPLQRGVAGTRAARGAAGLRLPRRLPRSARRAEDRLHCPLTALLNPLTSSLVSLHPCDVMPCRRTRTTTRMARRRRTEEACSAGPSGRPLPTCPSEPPFCGPPEPRLAAAQAPRCRRTVCARAPRPLPDSLPDVDFHSCAAPREAAPVLASTWCGSTLQPGAEPSLSCLAASAFRPDPRASAARLSVAPPKTKKAFTLIQPSCSPPLCVCTPSRGALTFRRSSAGPSCALPF